MLANSIIAEISCKCKSIMLLIHIHKCGGKFGGLSPQAPDERRLCVTNKDRSVAPKWPRPTARCQIVATGMLLLSRQSWSVHLTLGQPDWCFQVWSGGRPAERLTWRSYCLLAWCAEMSTGSLAICPHMAFRFLAIRSDQVIALCTRWLRSSG